MADVILLEYSDNLDKLIINQKNLQTEMKNTEKTGVDSANKTTAAFVKTDDAAKSLKTQLRELKAQLAIATDPKDVERLAKAAGEVKNKLDDATKAAQIFASDSKFEQVGTALRGIAGNLLSLNFKQAADQSKLLVAASKQITFKEALGGVKDLGTTLFNVGKSLLSNPLFLLGTAITIIISNFDKLVKAGGAIGAFFKGISDTISFITSGLERLGNSIGLIDSSVSKFAYDNKKLFEETASFIEATNAGIQKNITSILQAQGKLTDAQAQELQSREAAQKKFEDNELERKLKLAEAIKKADLDSVANIDDLKEARKELNNQIEIINKQYDLRRRNIANEAEVRLELIRTTAINKEIEEEKKKTEELLKEAKRLADLRLKAKIEEYAKLASVQQKADIEELEGIAKRWQDEIDDAAENEEIIADLTGPNGSVAKAEQQAQFESYQNHVDLLNAKKAKFDEYFGYVADAVQDLGNLQISINNRNAEQEIANAEDVANKEIEELDRLLKNKEISQSQYDAKKLESDKKLQQEEFEIKRKTFEANRQITLLQTIISTAQATVAALGSLPYTPANIALAAATAAAGAVQIALIESQPAPKFAKGVIDLKGKGTGTSDEIPAWLSVGESVIKADATKRTKPLLKSINEGNEFKYIQEYYVAPALKSQIKKMEQQKDKSFAENVANSFILKQQLNDKNLLKSLEKSRKNDNTIARFLGSKLDQAVTNKRQW